MTPKSIFLYLGTIVLLLSCSNDPLDVDNSAVKLDLGFVQLDSVFVNSNKDQLISEHHKFLKEITEIYEYELGYCIGLSDASDSTFYNGITLFLNDPYISRLEKRIAEKFSNLEVKKERISNGFKYLKFHFPKAKMPENVVFMNSFFASNAFSTEKQIGIGLERYLGKETDVIKELPGTDFPEWVRDGMDEKYMERDAICSWVMTHLVKEVDGNLAENIVRWGKILYLTKAAFPQDESNYALRYSKEDYEWAVENEYAFWKYLVDEDLLFKIDELNIKNMLGEGPFTPGLPEKGPDRLGQFMGLRMIENYMKINEVPLEKLIKLPYTEILAEYEIE